ncbi:hypothetical protein CCACVL1_09685 [Corchorus capsularis]|uniref:Uncharacterized protein n=1 Tax=Corchorus capsularis TaxID=210143 RepID=A0A1R3IUM8_COCAP|nr:hypothetical protein CCACVL1_09685 [Corchorus capsularis]
METKATDSNAVTRLQRTSSTMKKLKLLISAPHRGIKLDEETNDRNDTKSDATHRNADVAHLPAIFNFH